MPGPSEASSSKTDSPKRPASTAATPPDVKHGSQPPSREDAETGTEEVTFKSMGVIDPLLEALEQMKFTTPTEIQRQAIPYALQGRDIIGVAETGSGKTAAFALPILQKLWEDPKGLFACVLAPTRELAYQISQQFESLGSSMGARCAVIVGGMSMMDQAVALAKRPHIVIATPGRLKDHLKETKGFNLRSIKFLVMDEADRLLDMDFGPVIDDILKLLPQERNTYLFSATMSTKIAKLQRASLSSPVRVEVSTKYTTVSTLLQHYVLTPYVQKDLRLVHILTTLSQNSIIIFTRTVHDCQRLSLVLRSLGVPAIPLHGQLAQSARLGALNKFKTGGRTVLVATDVASRGLDIPHVDVVINFDIPQHSKDYIHRVGRTARAGRAGKSITLVSQYDVELCQRIEEVTGVKMTKWEAEGGEGSGDDEVALLRERVAEAQRLAIRELKDMKGSKGAGGAGQRKARTEGKREAMDRDDDEHEAGMPSRKKYKGRR